MDYLLVHFKNFGDVYQESDAGRITRYIAPDGKFLFSEPPPGENYVHVDSTPKRLDWMPAIEPTDLYYTDYVKAREYDALDPDYKTKAVTSVLSAAKVNLYLAQRDLQRLKDNPEAERPPSEEAVPTEDK